MVITAKPVTCVFEEISSIHLYAKVKWEGNHLQTHNLLWNDDNLGLGPKVTCSNQSAEEKPGISRIYLSIFCNIFVYQPYYIFPVFEFVAYNFRSKSVLCNGMLGEKWNASFLINDVTNATFSLVLLASFQTDVGFMHNRFIRNGWSESENGDIPKNFETHCGQAKILKTYVVIRGHLN